MRRPFGEILMSMGAAGIVLLSLVAIDDRVRDQIALRLASPSMSLALARQQMQSLSYVLTDVVKYQSLEHAPLLAFVFLSSVLFLLMIRT